MTGKGPRWPEVERRRMKACLSGWIQSEVGALLRQILAPW